MTAPPPAYEAKKQGYGLSSKATLDFHLCDAAFSDDSIIQSHTWILWLFNFR